MSLIIVFHNDSTGSPGIGNYNVSVRINTREIATGRVEGHLRSLGWEALLGEYVDQLRAARPRNYPRDGGLDGVGVFGWLLLGAFIASAAIGFVAAVATL